MTSPTIVPHIRITEMPDPNDAAGATIRSAEMTVEVRSGATTLHHEITARCDSIMTAQAIMAAHLTGLAVDLTLLAGTTDKASKTVLEGGLEGFVGTVEVPFHDKATGEAVPFQVVVPGAVTIDDAKDKAGDILRAFAALVQRDQDTLVIRAQSRANQMAALQQVAETAPYVRQGCEYCDVL